MRFLLYNIRYATGGRRYVLPFGGYLHNTRRHFEKIVDFIKSLNPDIIGLVEVDMGSYRSGRKNQVTQLAEELGHYHAHRCKYQDNHLAMHIPVFNRQGNAFITRDTIHEERFHYFERGMKRLVIELELERVNIFLVHLALSFRVRHQQLAELYELVKKTDKPAIVAGDFNSLWGDREIDLFLGASGLINAGPGKCLTFPSWAPKRPLDFILHSPEIEVEKFQVPQVQFSDHLPLVCDFALK